jgi:hypothetical protein
MWKMLLGMIALMFVAPALESTGWRLDATWALVAAMLAVQPGNRAIIGAACGGFLLDVLAGGTAGPRLLGMTIALTSWTLLAPPIERRGPFGALALRKRHWTDRPLGLVMLTLLTGGSWWCAQFAAVGLEQGWGREVLWRGTDVLADVASAWRQTGRDGLPPALATGLLAATGALLFSRMTDVGSFPAGRHAS